jgi:hypothetical protein
MYNEDKDLPEMRRAWMASKEYYNEPKRTIKDIVEQARIASQR